jgi:hypothetical protein
MKYLPIALLFVGCGAKAIAQAAPYDSVFKRMIHASPTNQYWYTITGYKVVFYWSYQFIGGKYDDHARFYCYSKDSANKLYETFRRNIDQSTFHIDSVHIEKLDSCACMGCCGTR